jgi:hypothetical protein
MKRRIYSVLPDVSTARAVHNELLLSRVEESQMHFLANDNVDLADLPRANLLQTSDVIHGLQIGLIYGGVTGMFAGTLAMPVLGLTLQTGAVIILALALAGTIVGAWSSSMVAISMPNRQLKQFESAIKKGRILLLLDVSKDRVVELTKAIESHYPQVDVLGVEPTIPAFP